MGNLNSQAFKFKFLCTTLLLLVLITHNTAHSSAPSSNQEIQPHQNPSPSTTTFTTLSHYHQVFYLKNKDPAMFVTRQERDMIKKRRINRNKKMMKHRKKKKKMVKNLQSRPFSVMLPKGFVPPSGSSPCHNDQPNSVSSSSFHCHLTTIAQP